MPQANITYDTEYNRRLVSKVRKNEARTTMANPPTELPMRNGSFHDPHERVVMQGGSIEREFILSGTSPAYPPINMRSGMEVSSGGAFIGVDGAVGGSFWKDFARGFTSVLDVAAAPLSVLMPPAGMAIGALSKGVKGLAGRGRARKHKRMMKSCPTCAEMGCPCGGAKSGGVIYNPTNDPAIAAQNERIGRNMRGENFKGFRKVGGEMLASPAAEVGKKMKKARAKKADMSRVMDAVEATMPMSKGGAKSGGAKSGGAKSGGAKSGGAKSGGAKSGGAKKGGRNARAEIVKKVMKERGVKMIEASKIVKKEGLY
jgi:hypothetical protein